MSCSGTNADAVLVRARAAARSLSNPSRRRAHATHVAEQIGPTDRAAKRRALRGTAEAGRAARGARAAWPALLAVVSQYLGVGMLVGASIGTAGMAVLFWFRLRAARRPRRIHRFVLIWIAWARCVASDDLNIELGAWRALPFDVHNCARSVDILTSAVG